LDRVRAATLVGIVGSDLAAPMLDRLQISVDLDWGFKTDEVLPMKFCPMKFCR
jgi:hypothetical protein